ncbi:hypothetical protein ACFY7Z_13315 [Streptomyces sp. NPDC012623]
MTSILCTSGDDEDDKKLPGRPWQPEEPSPDGEVPPGDGKHRK